MRMKLNQKRATGASGLGVIDFRSKLLEIVNLADSLAIDVSSAACTADLAHRHAQDSMLFADTGKGNDIYFPPHERKILGFIMDDVAVRLSKLDKMADELSNVLADLHDLMREANASESLATEV
ncbi:hypothetical protein [Agrobacterium pusense]|uniref:Uncharacterized protein n=1 Tax=Agrobacterium pusense TaxID=648995 RepID=A0AA44EMH3_9HYPH|nr:hypothetical protein [Agrobacterium pusense]NRF10866.1 hypothetical protein [Agrobacterium pusense]NRF21576.1 hypothetical protein [Agrobacterium pusense]